GAVVVSGGYVDDKPTTILRAANHTVETPALPKRTQKQNSTNKLTHQPNTATATLHPTRIAGSTSLRARPHVRRAGVRQNGRAHARPRSRVAVSQARAAIPRGLPRLGARLRAADRARDCGDLLAVPADVGFAAPRGRAVLLGSGAARPRRRVQEGQAELAAPARMDRRRGQGEG